MKNKNKLRIELQNKRDALSKKEVFDYSEKITAKLLSNTLYKECNHICIYEAFRNEVSCSIIKKQAFADKKQVYVPVVDIVTKTMNFYEITPDTIYRRDCYGILEPVLQEHQHTLQHKALVLMPGLGFDGNKHRLGYGGGYYDKYLALHPEHTTIALCFQFQIVQELPYEEHDILPDYILTEQNLYGK